MHAMLQGFLKAYRPLYLRGLLMDGQYPRPMPDASNRTVPAHRRRLLLAALTGLQHTLFHHRSQP